MSQLMVAPGPADLVDVDALVAISMHKTTVVVRPTRHPDRLGTRVLTDVVNAATVAGSTVVLRRPSALVDASASIDVPPGDDGLDGAPITVDVAGVGLLRVRSEGVVWTIDYVAARFVRSDRPIDRLFLASSDWTDFEAVWIGPPFVRVLTTNGSYIVGRRTLRHPSEREIPSDRRATMLLRDIA